MYFLQGSDLFQEFLMQVRKNAELQWTVTNNSTVRSFVVESSIDGGGFV